MAKDTYIPRNEVVDMNKEFNKVRQKAEEELMKFPGVVAVGVGLKEVKGIMQRQLCFKVTVEKKKANSAIKAKDRIPEDIYGFKTDVNERVIGVAYEDGSKYRPLIGGCKIGNSENNVPGTLGCLAKRKTDDKIVLLSNWHVIVDNPDTIDGARVGQPTHNGCCSCCASNEIGKTVDGRFRTDNMDAAIALLNGQDTDTIPEERYLNEIIGVGIIAGSAAPVAGETVWKRGYFTALTKGQISNDRMNPGILYNEYNGLVINRTNQYEVMPVLPHIDFALQGDSGSVCINEHNQAVLLIYGGIPATHRTFATDITSVATTLGITILDSSFHTSPPGKEGVPLSSIANYSNTSSLAYAMAELEAELAHFREGKRMLELFKNHRVELLDLVNHRREVMAAWNRYQGPSYLAHMARSVRRENKPVPEQIKGITLPSLLLKMTAVLQRNGSPELAQSVTDNYLPVMNILSAGRSPDDWKACLAQMDQMAHA